MSGREGSAELVAGEEPVVDLAAAGALVELQRRFAAREGRLQAFLYEERRWARLEAALAALAERKSGAEPKSGAERKSGAEASSGSEPRAREERPALAALPVGVKDIFHVAGLPTRAGSSLPPAELAGEEGTAVARLRAAGAVVVGKTATTEFAYFAPASTTNPRAPGRTPGGSSSGSAAAVAAGLCPLALGTQTIGSICRPAAYCGVVGFKPSYERVPRDGVIPLSPAVDHVGWLAADVAIARRAAAVLLDGWRGDAASPDGDAAAGAARRRPVLAVPTGPYLERASEGARAALAAACARLAAAGHEVRWVAAMPDFDDVDRSHRLLVAAEAAAVHQVWYARHAERYHRETRALIERGRAADPAAVARARDGRLRLREELTALMDTEGIDLWLSPAAPGAPPRGLLATGDPVMNLPWTHAGLPALALPAGSDAEGLPFGAQLTARFAADETLLAWGETMAPVLAR